MIEKQLKRLLYRFDCVIMPNFGAFLAKNISSQYHTNTQIFYPPKRTLTFNAQLKSDDGLLIKSLAKTHHLSYAQAEKEVHDFVNDLNTTLETSHKIYLEQIGTFEHTSESILRFYPDNNSLRTDTFGLQPLQIESLYHKNTDSSSVQVLEPEKNQPQEESATQKSPLYIKYAAIGLIALGIIGLIGYSAYQNQFKKHNSVVEDHQKPSVKDQLQSADFQLQHSLPKFTFSVTNDENVVDHQQDKHIKFHIIAGAFRYKSNAIKKQNQLKKQGFESQMIGKNTYGLHQVSYKSFATREDALNSLRKIKQNEDQRAWLLIKEL
jgi:hypothetical protein